MNPQITFMLFGGATIKIVSTNLDNGAYPNLENMNLMNQSDFSVLTGTPEIDPSNNLKQEL